MFRVHVQGSGFRRFGLDRIRNCKRLRAPPRQPDLERPAKREGVPGRVLGILGLGRVRQFAGRGPGSPGCPNKFADRIPCLLVPNASRQEAEANIMLTPVEPGPRGGGGQRTVRFHIRFQIVVTCGEYPFQAKKGADLALRIWRGLPVLTTCAPSVRGLGGL